jgi:hypothetical protein
MNRLNLSPEALERFWVKVDKKGEDDCWLWTAALNSKGYGSFAVEKKGVSAHKIAWALVNNDGVLSDSKSHIMHSCDVRSCVNPRHLTLGTALENTRDAIRKGRNVIRIPSLEAECKKGHPRTPENTDKKYNTCIICRRDADREAKRRLREKDREAYNTYHRERYQNKANPWSLN